MLRLKVPAVACRHRLGVRTRASQPRDRGSNPRTGIPSEGFALRRPSLSLVRLGSSEKHLGKSHSVCVGSLAAREIAFLVGCGPARRRRCLFADTPKIETAEPRWID